MVKFACLLLQVWLGYVMMGTAGQGPKYSFHKKIFFLLKSGNLRDEIMNDKFMYNPIYVKNYPTVFEIINVKVYTTQLGFIRITQWF